MLQRCNNQTSGLLFYLLHYRLENAIFSYESVCRVIQNMIVDCDLDGDSTATLFPPFLCFFFACSRSDWKVFPTVYFKNYFNLLNKKKWNDENCRWYACSSSARKIWTSQLVKGGVVSPISSSWRSHELMTPSLFCFVAPNDDVVSRAARCKRQIERRNGTFWSPFDIFDLLFSSWLNVSNTTEITHHHK